MRFLLASLLEVPDDSVDGDGFHVTLAVWLSKMPRSVPSSRGTPDTTLSIVK